AHGVCELVNLYNDLTLEPFNHSILQRLNDTTDMRPPLTTSSPSLKAMRGRIALQSTSCEIHPKAPYVLRSFGSAPASPRRLPFCQRAMRVSMACLLSLAALGTAAAQLAPTWKPQGKEPLERYDN